MASSHFLVAKYLMIVMNEGNSVVNIYDTKMEL